MIPEGARVASDPLRKTVIGDFGIPSELSEPQRMNECDLDLLSLLRSHRPPSILMVRAMRESRSTGRSEQLAHLLLPLISRGGRYRKGTPDSRHSRRPTYESLQRSLPHYGSLDVIPVVFGLPLSRIPEESNTFLSSANKTYR